LSLKAFHIVFVVVSTFLAGGFAVWAFREYHAKGEGGTLALGVASAVATVVLLWYGRWFLRKLKRVSYL